MKFLSTLLLIAISQAAIIHVPADAPTIQTGNQWRVKWRHRMDKNIWGRLL